LLIETIIQRATRGELGQRREQRANIF
jgi:hypothetical protein